MWRRLVGREVKIVLRRDGDYVPVFFGKVIDANDSFVVEKDRFGKLHFLAVSEIIKVSESKLKAEKEKEEVEVKETKGK